MFKALTKDDIYIARRLFQLEIHKSNGQAFENLFSKIMRLYNVEFIQIKPQGKFGDRKNDGFIKSKGIYYQVYSPEDASTKEFATINKLVKDFSGLYAYWNSQVTPIKDFHFVLNDKYQGAYPSIFPELKKIETSNAGVKSGVFLSQHLEDIFLALPHAHIEDVLGKIPSAEDINLNISILNEVIGYLVGLKDAYSNETFPVNPNFEEKITFNALGAPIATYLRFGSYQDGALKDYFKINSTFTKDDLKTTFNNLYKDGLKTIPDASNKADLIFLYILENAYPEKDKVYKDAIFVLMSYFFGYCDIFEEPPIREQAKLF